MLYLASKLLDDKTKTLVKAGFLNADLSITDKGRRILDSVLILENIDELVSVAEGQLKKEKEAALN